MSDGTARAGEFYSRWAGLYDRLATDAPLVARLRDAFVGALALTTGDVVVEMGCGTGANLQYFREAVGNGGAVVGVDVSAGVLERAQSRIDRAGWENVHVVRADATRPPVTGPLNVTEPVSVSNPESDSDSRSTAVSVSHPQVSGHLPPGAGEVDCIAASFVSGMLADPESGLARWADILGEGGRIAVMDLARSTTVPGRLLNPLFRVGVRASSPPGTRTASGVTAMLDQRVLNAHQELHQQCPGAATDRYLAGFVRISAGTVQASPQSES